MLERNNIIISPGKGQEFEKFLKANAKDQNFWKENKDSASKPIDKAKLEALFKN